MCGVGAPARLGNAKGGYGLAAAYWREDRAFLAFVGARADNRSDQPGEQQNVGGVEVVSGDLLVGDPNRNVVEVASAEARLGHRREQAHPGQLRYYFAWQVIVLVATGVGRGKLAAAELG